LAVVLVQRRSLCYSHPAHLTVSSVALGSATLHRNRSLHLQKPRLRTKTSSRNEPVYLHICKSAYYHIRSLHHIRSAITDDMAKSVALSLVCSRLDYANSLLYGTTQKISIGSSASKIHLPELLLVMLSRQLRQDTHSSGILKHL